MSRALYTYTVYDSPKDYPGLFVVRRFQMNVPEPIPDPEPYLITTDLEQARGKLTSLGLYPLPRDPKDDPVIVETWI